MIKKNWFLFSLAFLVVFLPIISHAALVPCGNTNNIAGTDIDESQPCTLCHLVYGIKNLIDWGAGILITVGLVGIFISGLMYVISTGDSQMMETAKNFMKSVVIGMVIFLSAWLIIEVVIWILGAKIGNVVPGSGIVWFKIEC